MSLDYNKKNVVLARNLRKAATPQERHLWYDFLSKYKVRFQRQKPIGNYIVDFYCHAARLIVELDGSQHYESAGTIKDQIRAEQLEQRDLMVVRIPNNAVNEHFEGVCEYIDHVVNQRI